MDGTSPIRHVSTTPIVHARDHSREEQPKPFSIEEEAKDDEEDDVELHIDEPVGPPDDDEAGQRLDIRA